MPVYKLNNIVIYTTLKLAFFFKIIVCVNGLSNALEFSFD